MLSAYKIPATLISPLATISPPVTCKLLLIVVSPATLKMLFITVWPDIFTEPANVEFPDTLIASSIVV